ncbi:MAG TPA: glycosyltransferase family 2 protein [Actinomycetota bacterium]
MILTVAILALNEEAMIARAIASCSFADEILVVDGGSTDATVETAQRAGARVVVRPFDDFARQRNFCLEQAAGEWVLFVDADERATPELAAEVRALLDGVPSDDAYAVPRQAIVLGHRLGWQPFGRPDAPVRLLRRGSCRWSGVVHEAVEGASSYGALQSHLLHLTHRTVSEVVRKIDAYTEIEAESLVATGARVANRRRLLASFPREAWQLWRSGLRREGMAGAVEAVLLAFNRTLVLAKVWEKTNRDAIDQAYARAEEEAYQPGEAARAHRSRDLPLR